MASLVKVGLSLYASIFGLSVRRGSCISIALFDKAWWPATKIERGLARDPISVARAINDFELEKRL